MSAGTALAPGRRRAITELNDLFRSGRLPERPLDGRYQGELILFSAGPGLDQLAELISRIWQPWRGKVFGAARGAGENVFSADALLATRLYWPEYRNVRPDTPGTFRAFRFQTSTAPGTADPDREVLRINYNLPENPRRLVDVRAVLDEVVEIGDRLYLGKAHLRLPWGGVWTVAYFTLRPESAPLPAEPGAGTHLSPAAALASPRALVGTFLPLAILAGLSIGIIGVIRRLAR